jgi:hypothetical protein
VVLKDGKEVKRVTLPQGAARRSLGLRDSG